MTHEGKIVVVTGAASGIGAAIAERFIHDGAIVVVSDINVSGARSVAQKLGKNSSFVECDVRSEASVEELVSSTVTQFGRLDFMVNNAAIMRVAPLVEMKFNDWRVMFDVNVHGIFLGSKAAARQMILQENGGVIINGSSGAGRKGVPYFSAYCATKAAIINMSQTFAQELAEHKIRVNCYTPGHIKTPFWDQIADGYGKWANKSREEVIEMFRSTVPWGRFGKPEEVAAAVSWLCTRDADYVSGQCIAMNGAELPW